MMREADEGAIADLAVSPGETGVDIEEYRGPVELENRMNQVVIPLDAFGVDLAGVDAVRFESGGGTIFSDDVRFVGL